MIEYGRAPVNCVKAAHDLEPEDKYKAHNSDIIAWTAPDEDKARSEAEIAAQAFQNKSDLQHYGRNGDEAEVG